MHISPSHEHEAFNRLSNLPEVIEIHPLLGEYDFIAKIVSVGYESIEEIVINEIRAPPL